MIFPITVIALAFGVDRLSKWWAADFLAQNGTVEISPFLTIHETYNRGLAFGLLQGVGPLMGWVSLVIVLVMLVYLLRLPRNLWLLRLGLALIIGGALGNMLDRIIAGQVLDFIMTPLRPGVFNLADICINAGMILALIGLLFQRPEKSEPLPIPETESP